MLRGFAHLPFLPRHRVPGLTALYLNAFLHNFAMAMLGIFIPLYLWRVLGSLGAVLGYFVLDSAAVVLTVGVAARFVSRHGFRRAAALGTFFLILAVLGLIAGGSVPHFLLAAALLGGSATGFYWLPYHLIFAEDGRKASFGQEVSFMSVVSHLAGISGPLLGGLIVTIFSFKVLYFTAVVILVLSLFPLLVMVHHPIHHAPTGKELWQALLAAARSLWRKVFVLARFETDILDVFWPLFAFSVFGSYQTVGGVASAALLLSLVLLAFSGRLTDRWSKVKTMTIGAGSTAGAWCLLPFSITAGAAFVVSLWLKSSRVFFYVPFDALLYTQVAKEKTGGALTFLVFREWVLHGSRVLLFGFLFVLLSLGLPWQALFYLAAVCLPLAALSFKGGAQR